MLNTGTRPSAEAEDGKRGIHEIPLSGVGAGLSLSLSSRERLAGVDLARSIALFGMFIIHFDSVLGPAGSGPLWYFLVQRLVSGAGWALFVVQLGVGISLRMARRARAQGHEREWWPERATLLRRGLFLFVAGLLFLPIWRWDILHFMGVYLCMAAVLCGATSRQLCTAIVVTVVIFHVLFFTMGYSAALEVAANTYGGSWNLRGFVPELVFKGYYPVLPWFSFALVGMWLGRQNLESQTLLRKLVLLGVSIAGLGHGGALLSRMSLASRPEGHAAQILRAFAGTVPMPPTLSFLCAAAGSAVAICAASLLVAHRFRDARAIRALATVGQQSLTHYIAHILVAIGIARLVRGLEVDAVQLSLGGALAYSVLAVLSSVLWRRRFGGGPIELVMRRVTG